MITPITDKAYNLLHEGALAFSDMEANGIRIDVDYLLKAKETTQKKIDTLTANLKNDIVYKKWKERFKETTNINSNEQLGVVLFDILGFEVTDRTETEKKPKTDEAALSKVNSPFVKKYLEVKKQKKVLDTYIAGILREVTDGFLHPSFNLHTVQTYRSSSSNPNFQNLPIRDYENGKLIRQCFISRGPDWCLVEADYSQIEVHGATWHHKDPTMLAYLADSSCDSLGNKNKDLHRDMAQKCYILSKQELYHLLTSDKTDKKRIKNIRYCGKNRFVFPQFYGDWWKSCAEALWESIDVMNLHLRNGQSIKEHLKVKGITKLGDMKAKNPGTNTFLNHIKKVEEHFWNEMFPVYTDWKNDWYNEYLQRGGFETLTGFYIDGVFKRNQVINAPVQGVAFHCLLWSLIQINKILKERKMKSVIIGQIHDSIVADVHKTELQEFLKIIRTITTEKLKEHWDFIITQPEIEIEIAPFGKSWHEKETYEEAA